MTTAEKIGAAGMLQINGKAHSEALALLSDALNTRDDARRAALAEQLRTMLTAATASPSPSEPRRPSRETVALTDMQLAYLNALLPWSSFFVDDKGRVVGNRYRDDKRDTPDSLRDKRIDRLAAEVDAQETLTATEYGCFEGNHTVQLCRRFASVTAIDGRLENCLKTMARCWVLGHRPDVRLIDLEDAGAPLPEADVAHHVGVLYHLTDPVAHLRAVLAATRKVLLLDTQVAKPGDTNHVIAIDGVETPVFRYNEKDIEFAPFAGMRAYAIWLTDEAIAAIARAAGFEPVAHELRDERNGLRLMTLLKRR